MRRLEREDSDNSLNEISHSEPTPQSIRKLIPTPPPGPQTPNPRNKKRILKFATI